MGCGILLRFASIEPSLTEVNCGSLPLAISFSFRPTPSCQCSFVCLPQIFPRPQVGGRADRYRFAVAGGDTIRLLSSYMTAHSRCSFAIAHFCLLQLVPALFRPSATSRSPSRRPIRKAGSGFRFVCSPLPACFNRHGKGGAGIPSRRLLPVPPVSHFLMALSFPYFSGMVMGYSVATVMYFS